MLEKLDKNEEKVTVKE